MNDVLYKDKVKDHDIVVCETDYGAILALVTNKTWNGVSQSQLFLGGFVNLEEAKKTIYDYIDKNVVLNLKMERARKEYDAVMAE